MRALLADLDRALETGRGDGVRVVYAEWAGLGWFFQDFMSTSCEAGVCDSGGALFCAEWIPATGVRE